ncbi:hypothetical protein IMSHALPRED_002380 [Imshaugia aleurites]|uniref:Uncharacterized protein n=1 Tax=Imshaugia aleurites TaxID=172621 RepID=A0A8H3IE77_9LECA|nr:hypothetical protein IMSHALPRED_002380 [Imshaugia aleurites]
MRILPNFLGLCEPTLVTLTLLFSFAPEAPAAPSFEALPLAKRAVLPSIVPISLPTVPTNEATELPAVLSNFTANGLTISNTSLAAAQIFKYRVPHSTIELHVTTTNPIDGQILGSTLLRIHEFINDEISRHGDGPLGPKDDPFVWAPSGPHTVAPGLTTNNLPVKLRAESMPGESMTWSLLLITVEGLYLCLPAVGRDFGSQFEIWDWRDHEQWGFGEVKAVNP